MDLKLFFAVILVFSSCSILCISENVKNLNIAEHDDVEGDADPGMQELGGILNKDLNQGLSGILQQSGFGNADGLAQFSCMEKVMPCRPYLHDPATPPAACCEPLKQLVENDTECVCHVFNDEQILKSFNVTQEDALKIPKACGTEVDVSVCKNLTKSDDSTGTSAGGSSDATTGGSPPDTISRGPSDATTEKTSDTSSTDSAENGALSGISNLGYSGFIAVLIALLF